jgi:hypothetical protein
MAQCNQCEKGYYYLDGEYNVCYHCSGTGQVSDEQAQDDRESALIEQLARESVYEEKRALNESDNDGEDWAFHAAENMLSEHEYTKTMIVVRTDTITKLVKEKNAERHLVDPHFHSLNELRAILGWPLKVEGSTVDDPKTPTDEDVRAD